ncbi:hypothetical protein HA402_015135 [Bradysia odoriphaga]|nr:hypothetical protein HA402_015135 [Bradysia odoriphaga]
MNVIEDNTCRLCFSASENNVNIFSANESDGLTSIGRMIVDCLLSELEPNTGYPEIVCHLCQLQLNVFYEFKKKVFQNQEKFTTILSKQKQSKPGPLSKKSPPKNVDDDSKKKRLTRSSVKVENTSHTIDNFESIEPQPVDTKFTSPKCLKRINAGVSDEPDIKFIKLETEELDLNDDCSPFKEDGTDDDETEQYLEEQYLDNYSEIDENTEVEYVYEDEVDDENCNSFREEYSKVDDDGTERTMKKVRKPKSPKVKKYITERVLDADTMKEYDAVKCLNCNEYFETMDKFTTHHKACDKAPCVVCGKMLSSSGMDLHMRQHDSEKPYICSICNKGFTTAQQCSDHEFRHKNQRPFECHICDKTFKMKCDLRTHIMCHQDIRKHACPICEKAFRQLSHLRNHIETHASEHAYECEVCGRTFKTRVTMQNHVRQMHTEEHEFQCDICERGFYRKNRLERHRQTHFRTPKRIAGDVDSTDNAELQLSLES